MMNNRQKKLLDQIGKAAVKSDWEVAFGGKSYGNRHLYRVNKIAKFLLNQEGGDEFITLTGAWVHDVILAVGRDDDSKKIANFTRIFLKSFKGLEKDELEKIVGCAAEHESGEALSLEAKIVHDSDVVDKSGMLGVIRHIWKMTNMLNNKVLSGDRDLLELEEHLGDREKKLFTKTAKKLADNLNKERKYYFNDRKFALRVMSEISEMANRGLTSDRIVKNITEKEDHPSMLALSNQLSCEYLK